MLWCVACPFRKLISHEIKPPTVHNSDVNHRPLGIVLRFQVPEIEPIAILDYPSPETDVCASDDTTRQNNAHSTETRSVCYPWHPWYNHAVVIRQAMVKGNLAIFRGQLEPGERTKSLEIPQWMFDPVICSAIHLQVTPCVGIDALLDLKALFADATVYTDSAVLQAEPLCLTPRGEANATHSATEHSTRAVSSTPTRTAVAESCGGDTSRGGDPVDSTPVGTPTADAAIHPGGAGEKR